MFHKNPLVTFSLDFCNYYYFFFLLLLFTVFVLLVTFVVYSCSFFKKKYLCSKIVEERSYYMAIKPVLNSRFRSGHITMLRCPI